MHELEGILFVGVACMLGVLFISWIAWDTHRNLTRKYPQATDTDVDQFMRENEGLMNDLASGELEGDSVWVLSFEIWQHVGGGAGMWIRMREGVYLNAQRAYDDFSSLIKRIENNPTRLRSALCERARLIR